MNNPWYIKYTYILAAIILTIYAVIIAKSLLQPLLFALFFSILLSPFCGRMEKHKVPRILAVSISIICGILALFGIGFFLYSQIAAFTGEADLFRERFEEILEHSQALLTTWFGVEEMIDINMIQDSIYEFFRENTGTLTRGVAGAATVFTSIFLVPVFMFFMLLFRDFLKEFLLMLFGRAGNEELQKIGSIINKVKGVVQGYLTGIILVIMILAVLNSILLFIIGVNHAIFFGVFAAMLNVIPFVGPLIGSILPILYALFTMDSLLIPLFILIGFYVIQLMESNIFTPIIVGSQVSINAFVALLLLFVGAQVWGIIGMILIIPIGAIMKVVFDEVESLKPYGFVMGTVPGKFKSRKSLFAAKMSEISERVSRELQEQQENDKQSDENNSEDSQL